MGRVSEERVNMRVLVACEFSGIVRDAFKARGHDAWSCDLLPCEADPKYHIQADILSIIKQGWDLMIAHPPCTHLCCSGARWFYKKKKLQEEALEFFRNLLAAPVKKLCVENPVGIVSSRIRPPDQIIQPYYFGDAFQKTTCLWLKGLPCLAHWDGDNLFFKNTHTDKGEFVTFASGKKMPKWYADLGRTKEAGYIRSKTFQGIANAMAEQWG